MVRAILDGRKTQTRRTVTMNNSTVLGDRWGAKSPWSGLDFTRATPRTQSTIMRYIAGDDAPRDIHLDVPFLHPEDAAAGMEHDGCVYRVRPIWEAGDALWVRESGELLREAFDHDPQLGKDLWRDAGWRYADGALAQCRDYDPPLSEWADDCARHRRPSIHMPRWASRITLRITDVRVERLNEISHEDCWAEGVICDIHGAKKHTCCSGLTRGYRNVWEAINGPGSWDKNPWVWVVAFEPAAAREATAEHSSLAPAELGPGTPPNPSARGEL